MTQMYILHSTSQSFCFLGLVTFLVFRNRNNKTYVLLHCCIVALQGRGAILLPYLSFLSFWMAEWTWLGSWRRPPDERRRPYNRQQSWATNWSRRVGYWRWLSLEPNLKAREKKDDDTSTIWMDAVGLVKTDWLQFLLRSKVLCPLHDTYYTCSARKAILAPSLWILLLL